MKNTFNIFIVEVNRMYQKMFTHILGSDKTLELFLFDNGQHCLDALGQKPDIVFMDYYLPDLDGVSLIGRIRSQNPNTEVIVLSGQVEISTALQLLRLGVYDVITKDVTMKYRLVNIIKHLKELIALRQQLIELSSTF